MEKNIKNGTADSPPADPPARRSYYMKDETIERVLVYWEDFDRLLPIQITLLYFQIRTI